jgi:hypothetical protein
MMTEETCLDTPRHGTLIEDVKGLLRLLSAKSAVRGCVMSIRPFLSGQPLIPRPSPKCRQHSKACAKTLSLKMVDDAATRLVARKIIELTQRGVRDAAALRAMTLNEFKYE